MELTCEEIVDVLEIRFTTATSTGYTLQPCIYEISDINLMSKSSLLDIVKINITIDDIRLRSNLTTNKKLRFTKEILFYTTLDFVQSHSGVLGDSNGLIQFSKVTNRITLLELIYFI